MLISWYGQTCVRIQNPHVHILIDPFDGSVGLRSPRMGGAQIVLVSDPSTIGSRESEVFYVDGPGECERQGVSVQGLRVESDKKGKNEVNAVRTIYSFEVEGVRIAHLNLSLDLSDKDIESLGEVDVLLLAVGNGGRFIDGGTASRIVRVVDPKIVIPMGYAVPGLKMKLDKVDGFLKAMGAGKTEAIPKIVIKKKDLVGEETRVVVLKPV